MTPKISPGIIEDCCQLIKTTALTDISRFSFKQHSALFSNNKKTIYDFLNYIDIKELVLKNPLQKSDRQIKFMLLRLYINKLAPFWVNRIGWGIETEVFGFLKKDKNSLNLYYSLVDSGLISLEKKVIKWWYNNIYQNSDKKKIETGLDGEYLSMRYEERVLGIKKVLIEHMSLKKSDVGYDIKSIVSMKNPVFKAIEVKSISNLKMPYIYITKNEWKTSRTPNYVFHIWVIGKVESSLYLLKREDLLKDIPMNKGKGSWESVKINVSGILKNKVATLDNEVDDF